MQAVNELRRIERLARIGGLEKAISALGGRRDVLRCQRMREEDEQRGWGGGEEMEMDVVVGG